MVAFPQLQIIKVFGATCVFFSREGTRLWARVTAEQRLLSVTSAGVEDVPDLGYGDPLRSHASDKIVIYDQGEDGDSKKVRQYDARTSSWGKELVLTSTLPDAARYPATLAVSASGNRLAAMHRNGDRVELVIWDLETTTVLRRHDVDVRLPRPESVIAFTSDETAVIALHAGALHRWPIAGAPTAVPIASSGKSTKFSGFISGLSWTADQLLTANGRVLVHDQRGALALLSENGAVVWAHRGTPAYCPEEWRQCRASISPSGNLIVAAVGARAALTGKAVIEVFASDGSLLRSFPWRSGETVTDVAINDEGWIALGTNKRLDLFPPIDPKPSAPKKPKKPTPVKAKKPTSRKKSARDRR